ncbi:hypothetical protein H9Q70_009729 [Fusarium xylarioides]|nr:hypothetical protein H9Q70_009729 [Fusarium xylarioides]
MQPQLFEPCPDAVTIDLDTAQLILTTPGTYTHKELRLPSRCVSCYTNMILREIVSECGIRPMSEGETCGIEACNKGTLFGSDRCVGHLDATNLECWKSKQYQNYPALETALKYAATRQWVCPDSYEVVIDHAEQIRSGERPSAGLIILDDEFSPTTYQLFEFSIIDRVHGNTLVNTAVTHPSGLCHRKDRDDASHELLDLFQERLSKRIAKRVYSRAGSSIG